jgi:hypothetical protein
MVAASAVLLLPSSIVPPDRQRHAFPFRHRLAAASGY